MTKNTNNKQQVDRCWQNYVASGLVQKGLTAADFLGTDYLLPEFSVDNPKQAFKLLKEHLTADAYRKLNGRWRKYKYNASHNNTTLTIRRETLERLKQVALKAGFKDDNYDLFLEYLLDPEEEMTSAKAEVADMSMKSALNINEKAELLRAKLRFRKTTYDYMLSLMEYAFRSGWLAAKSLPAKRRSDAALDEAVKEHVSALKGL
ncbi:hypothetical protein RS130_16000 [Paraglaciecola aquimarina]|uniref:Uncharacterized protein n=1 Tax=Paraglaciecola aquimarina TaxID=1235557 RepID=A0ABU3SYV7_9ALTE|nr:hypothetical protein [Paraglaciecola aquimarina]MDU0355200.1 hypothetical protein [Paraglaciecola aquimarina]